MIRDMDLLPTDVVPLINKAWKTPFSGVESNKKYIAERGWFPYNQKLPMHKQLRDNMTMKDLETKKKWDWCHQLS